MRKQHTIKVDEKCCIGCGVCLKDCPADNLILQNKKAAVRSQHCIKCGHCVAICPRSAVSMSGFSSPPYELTKPAAVDKDRLLYALRGRRSIRQFTKQPVDSADLTQIIEAGRLTPTGKNAQSISYLVLVNGLKRYERLAVSFFRKLLPVAKLLMPAAKNMDIDEHFFFKKAPAAIVILSDDKVSGSLAAANMALMAEACGLRVLYSGFFTVAVNLSPSLRRSLSLNAKEKAVTTLVLGHPAVRYRRTAQKEDAVIRIV